MIIDTKLAAILIAAYLITAAAAYLFARWYTNRQFDKLQTLSAKLKVVRSDLAAAQAELELNRRAYQELDADTKDLQALRAREGELKQAVVELEAGKSSLESEISEFEKALASRKSSLNELIRKIDIYNRLDDLIDHGHFEIPVYLYETSERFAQEIKLVREQQKRMITEKTALTFPERTSVSHDPVVNKKILGNQVKLMLSAFNIECDHLIGRVKPSTYAATLERIEKLANTLEASAASLACGFDKKYVKLKFEECQLQYQYTLKRQDEVEEQRLIREQIREEQKAIKEYERAVAEAEKEEKMYRDLLTRARQELQSSSDEERAIAEARIASLEQQLAEAEAKEARAKSMAEQTRRGHVYVISNIGSFGEDVYKIGLTRRLDPMERVKELGDASVPFSFDVHAIIYADDAPALETALHREFSERRVNLINHRKEFFNVPLTAIREAVSKLAGVDADFRTTIAAAEYHESQRLREQPTKLGEIV